MKFSSILSAIGHGFQKVFAIGVKVAQVAEPIVDLAFPGISVLFNATVNEVAKTEAVAVAAGQQSGTGTQKLALVVQAIEQEYAIFAKANGVAFDVTHIESWISAIVQALNTIPAPVLGQSAPAAPAAPAASSPAPAASDSQPGPGLHTVVPA